LKLGIVSNLDSRGLEKDANLLSGVLKNSGHEVELLKFNQACESVFPLIIFLETVPKHYVRLSRKPPWIFVNPEFLMPEDIKVIQKSFSKVFCKTQEAHRICTELFGEKTNYTGFLSEDRMDKPIVRYKRFLHVSGKSQVKNTQAIIDAWRWKKNGKSLDADLTIVSDFPQEDLPNGVKVISRIDDKHLKFLQNVCRFHLQPSQTEGWSHVLHEALSVNANILTVDAPPMNEIKSAYKIRSCGHTMFNSVKMYQVSALDIYDAVSDLMTLGHRGFASTGAPRTEFLQGNEDFKQQFTAHLAQFEKSLQVAPEVTTPMVKAVKATPPRRKTGEGKTVAFLGNFRASESTENMILWALTERLGMDVIKLQEDQTTLYDLENLEFIDYFLWVRTPGWLQIPDKNMFQYLADLRYAGVRSFSMHLDKFWDIPEREKLIGKIPFWKVDFVFTADGSRQEDFAKRGVNHFWMKPAVSEVYCHPGTPRDEYRCDVGFVGARSYHAEYPFREKLVAFLEETYGNRFKHVQGVRGHLLNDVYASMKVVVGDCFGAGIPNYWSDRVPETIGRHGLLVHPSIKGLKVPMACYEAQDLQSLRYSIEALLSDISQNPRGVKQVVIDGVDYVRKHDTWTVRMREIFETVNQ